MAITISTKHTSNANGTGQIVAKGGGKQRTVTYLHEFSADTNHGLAAGELASVLGLAWSESITHDRMVDGRHRFTFPGVSLTK